MKNNAADIRLEIAEIGKIITSAALLIAVRNEVSKVMKEGFVVTDSKHHPLASKYDVVVRCGCDKGEEITRRIKSNIKNVDIGRIADDVIGVRDARRGRV